jgi:methionine salvage enolase-phosphatase E1
LFLCSSFVADVMFPYVKRHLPSYLDEHWDEAQTQADVKLLRELSLEDSKNGVAVPALKPKARSQPSLSPGP